jgi:hypothetical protein
MARPVDKRGRLDDDVFSYRVTHDQRVLISWHGKLVMTLNGKNAEKFLTKIAGLDGKDAQLVMAKASGNFKRGNERPTKT